MNPNHQATTLQTLHVDPIGLSFVPRAHGRTGNHWLNTVPLVHHLHKEYDHSRQNLHLLATYVDGRASSGGTSGTSVAALECATIAVGSITLSFWCSCQKGYSEQFHQSSKWFTKHKRCTWVYQLYPLWVLVYSIVPPRVYQVNPLKCTGVPP